MLAWVGVGAPTLSPGVIAEAMSDRGGAVTRTVRVFHPASGEIPPPVFKRIEAESPTIQAVVNDRPGPDDRAALESSLYTQNVLAIDVTATIPAGATALETTSHLVFDYAGREVKVPLRVQLTGRAEFSPDVSQVLFAGGTASALVGQWRAVTLPSRRPAGAIRVTGLPEWLGASASSADGGGTSVVLTVTSPPPQDASATVAITAGNGPAPAGTVQVLVFTQPPER
ncbi:hypothetical protein R5W23_002222 [Gemmata sp. JC673]|uniref:Uncharacterized protein n=1 Tax=Gemmata algarum TaxID=2975278 RepID=A0ABU5F089_9BACT|nr:hypothetical protein [Gemmata algarum]MDY3560973.1 hypothetical protein [Gemmata algarum]